MNIDYSITAEQVKILIRQGEGLTVEFKERYTPRIDGTLWPSQTPRAVHFSSACGMMGLLSVSA